MSRPVELKIYDLSYGKAKSLSLMFIGKQVDGIWHTGVVVGGTEYFFGQGIQQCPQHLSPFGTPLETVPMGNTEIPDDMIRDFIEDVTPRFNATTYNLLSNNCNSFSDSLCEFLVGKNIPEHILALPEEVMETPLGQQLLQFLRPALENTFSSATTAGFAPMPGAASNTQPPSSTSGAPSSADAGPQEPAQLPTASRSSEFAPQATAVTSTSANTKKAENSKEEYQAALFREFQRAQEQGIQCANAAAAAAIRRVAELVQTGVVMPPQLSKIGGTVSIAKE